MSQCYSILIFFSFLKLDSACGGIQCNLAGVTLLSNSEDWLQHCVYGRRVTFVPMSVQGNSLHSIIYTRVSTR